MPADAIRVNEERVGAYYLLTLDGLIGGACVNVGGAFLTFMLRNGEREDTESNRDATLALALDWLQSQGYRVSLS